jgi:hypothetical protein
MKSELMQRLTEELAGEVLNYQHVPSFGERDVLRAAGWRFPSGNAVGNNAYREARSGELIEVKFCFQMEKGSPASHGTVAIPPVWIAHAWRTALARPK